MQLQVNDREARYSQSAQIAGGILRFSVTYALVSPVVLYGYNLRLASGGDGTPERQYEMQAVKTLCA